jgi:hypothetical protein
MRVALFLTLLTLATVSAQTTWRLLPGANDTDLAASGWIVTSSATATTGDRNPTWNTAAGATLTFSLETNSTAHPLGFAAPATTGNTADAVGATGNIGCTNNTAANSFTQTTPGVPCVVTVPAPAAGVTWQYRCTTHVNMRGSIVSAAAAGSSSSSTGGAAVVSSSSSATTTPAPKQNGTASVTMPALTVVLATITAAAIVA